MRIKSGHIADFREFHLADAALLREARVRPAVVAHAGGQFTRATPLGKPQALEDQALAL